MFQIDEDMTIYITRGDMAYFSVTAENNGKLHTFRKGDVVRIKVFKKKDCSNVAFQKDFAVVKDTTRVDILLTEKETKIGDVISKPVDYWYEIELNPYTNPQTIIGYDDDGAKIFKLFPEGKDLVLTGEVDEEVLGPIDKELSLTSERAIQNQAVARAFLKIENDISNAKKSIDESYNNLEKIREIRNQIANLITEVGTVTTDDVFSKGNSCLGLGGELAVVGRTFSSQDIITDFGDANDIVDVKTVSKGQIISFVNNTAKEYFRAGFHGIIITNTDGVITEILDASDLMLRDYEVVIEEDGIVYIGVCYFSEICYELYTNVPSELNGKLDTILNDGETLRQEVGKLSEEISELKQNDEETVLEDTVIKVSDLKDGYWQRNSDYTVGDTVTSIDDLFTESTYETNRAVVLPVYAGDVLKCKKGSSSFVSPEVYTIVDSNNTIVEVTWYQDFEYDAEMNGTYVVKHSGILAASVYVNANATDDDLVLTIETTKGTNSLVLYADKAEEYLADSAAGDEALDAILTGKQILVRVPNADGGRFTAIYSPIYMYQLPNYENEYLYLFYLRDEKQTLDLSALGMGQIQLPIYDELKMKLSKKYNETPLG